jgi:phage shock protein C
MTQNPFSQQPYRQLRRSQADRKVAGVCGGVAEYFQVDPTLVRVAFVVISVLTGGAFLLAYLFALLVMPEQAPTYPASTPTYQAPAPSYPTATPPVA